MDSKSLLIDRGKKNDFTEIGSVEPRVSIIQVEVSVAEAAIFLLDIIASINFELNTM